MFLLQLLKLMTKPFLTLLLIRLLTTYSTPGTTVTWQPCRPTLPLFIVLLLKEAQIFRESK